MNKHQIKGQFTNTKGKLKEAAGKVTGDKSLEVEGEVEQAVGKSEAEYGNLKSKTRKDGQSENAGKC